MAEIVSEVVSRGGSTGGGGRPVISNTVGAGGAPMRIGGSGEGGGTSAPARGGSAASSGGGDGNTIENIVRPTGARPIPDRVQKMLDNLDKHGTVAAPAAGSEGTAASTAAPAAVAAAPSAGTTAAPAQPAGATAAPAATPAATAAPAAGAPPAAAPPPEIERLTTRNRELAAENERLRGGGARPEPSKRDKALDTAERGYLDNPLGSVRQLIALALGHEDPNHADVTAEMKGLYQDLTAQELGVTVDESQQAKKEAARTRHLLARDRRERAAPQEPAPSDTSGGPDAVYHTAIGNRLQERQTDGKTVAESNPVLEMLGPRPEAALFQVIRRGFESGELDPKADNNTLIQQAIDKVHKHFQSQHQVLAGIYGGATATSTAQQPTAATETASKEGQGQAPRSITNATASVAPATSPAKQSETTQPKRYRSEEERRRAIIQAKLGDK